MPTGEYNELYSQLSQMQSPELQPYLATMRALDEQMKELSKPDRQGLPPLLDAERLQTLMKAYSNAAEQAEKYFSAVPEAAGAQHPERELVRRISGIISHDMRTLTEYRNELDADPEAKRQSLPSLIENARTFTVDLSSVKIKSRNGQMSERLPMEITVNGKKLQGMFTKESHVMQLDKVLKRIADKAPTEEGKDAINGILDSFRAYGRENDIPVKGDESDYSTFANMLLKEKKGKERDRFLCDVLGHGKEWGNSAKSIKQKCGKAAVDELIRGINDDYGRVYTNVLSGINPKDRTDDRNAAMSKVASLLGVSNLICNAISMRFKDEKGNVVSGTFMEMAKGIDCTNPQQNLLGPLNPDAAFHDNPTVLRDLANLQALDYICGNTDRHALNMVFTFEDGFPPQVTGVQGIDNDLSFGARDFPDGHSKLSSLDNMRVIGEEMARKIEALTPEQLKFALREFSLSEKQLEFAGVRLQSLQAQLKKSREHYKDAEPLTDGSDCEKGYIRILPDEEFAKLKPHELMVDKQEVRAAENAGKKPPRNIFIFALNNISKLAMRLRNIFAKPAKLMHVAVANRAVPESVSAQKEAAKRLAEKVKKAGKPTAAAQPLYDAIARYQKFQNDLNVRLSGDPDNPLRAFDTTIGVNDLDRIKTELTALKAGAEKYMETNPPKKDRFGKLAADVLAYTNKLLNVPPEQEKEEKQTAIANERQATERFNREMSKMAVKLDQDKKTASAAPKKL